MRRRNFAVGADDNSILTDEQQENVIDNLREQLEKQNERTRLMLTVFGLCFSFVIMLLSAPFWIALQCNPPSPDILSISTIITSESKGSRYGGLGFVGQTATLLVTVFSFFCAVLYVFTPTESPLVSESSKRNAIRSIQLGFIIILIYYILYIATLGNSVLPLLPVLALLFQALCIYSKYETRSLYEELEKLNQKKYRGLKGA